MSTKKRTKLKVRSDGIHNPRGMTVEEREDGLHVFNPPTRQELAADEMKWAQEQLKALEGLKGLDELTDVLRYVIERNEPYVKGDKK